MLGTKRLAASIYIAGGESWTTQAFNPSIYAGEPSTISRIFSELGANEIFVQTRDSLTESSKAILRRISSVTFVPLSFGGGISHVEDGLQVARLGFEKVCVESAVYAEPQLIHDLSREIGSSSTIASVSFRGRQAYSWKSGETLSWEDSLRLIESVQALGAGEIKVNSVSNDGFQNGPDFGLAMALIPYVSVPMIYQGGVGNLGHVMELWNLGIDCVASATWLTVLPPYNAVLPRFPQALSVNNP